MLVSSYTCHLSGCDYENAVLRYDADSGAFLGVHINNIPGPYGMAIHPVRGTLLVVSRPTSTVSEYNLNTGSFIQTLVTAGPEGLHFPQNIVFKPDGNFLISSMRTVGFLDRFDGILEYDGQDGTFIGPFVNGGFQGQGCGDARCLFGANGMSYGPNGNLYVASSANNFILEYDGTTGAYVGYFDSTRLVAPSGLVVRPAGTTRAGNILVTSRYHDPSLSNDTDKIVEFDWVTRELASGHAILASGFVSPGPMYFHENGYLMLGDRLMWNILPNSSDRVLKLDPLSGAFLGSFTPIDDSHLHWSTAILAVAVVPSNVTDDYDNDGDVDLVDISWLQHCFGATPTLDCANAFDENLDGAITSADLSVLPSNFTGPLP